MVPLGEGARPGRTSTVGQHVLVNLVASRTGALSYLLMGVLQLEYTEEEEASCVWSWVDEEGEAGWGSGGRSGEKPRLLLYRWTPYLDATSKRQRPG